MCTNAPAMEGVHLLLLNLPYGACVLLKAGKATGYQLFLLMYFSDYRSTSAENSTYIDPLNDV